MSDMTPEDARRRFEVSGILRMRSDLVLSLRQVATSLDDQAEDTRSFDAPAARKALEQAERPMRRAEMEFRRLLTRVRAYEQKYPDADGAGAGVLR